MPAAVPCSHEAGPQHDAVDTRCHPTLYEPCIRLEKMSHPFITEGRQPTRGHRPRCLQGLLRIPALCTRLVAGGLTRLQTFHAEGLQAMSC